MCLFFTKYVVCLWKHLLKAIHNKDYSVVKTFGLLLVHKSGSFFYAQIVRIIIYQCGI